MSAHADAAAERSRPKIADRRHRWVIWLAVAWLVTGVGLAPTVWGDETPRVSVADPYLELRSGPGRGYPIFYIAERGEQVEILQRRTDWFKVRTLVGKEGWASREQMEKTLTEAGVRTTFRDVLFDDYLSRRLEFGFSMGQFEDDPILTVYAGYRVHEHFLFELAVAESTGDFSSTSLLYGAIVSQPYPDARWSPFLALGVGRFQNRPKSTLVNARDVDADMANVALGLRYYVTRQFLVRAEFKDHVALIDHDVTQTFQEYSVGIAFFF